MQMLHCDLARLHLLHKTCTLDVGNPDWTVRLNANTVHVIPARIMLHLNWGGYGIRTQMYK